MGLFSVGFEVFSAPRVVFRHVLNLFLRGVFTVGGVFFVVFRRSVVGVA